MFSSFLEAQLNIIRCRDVVGLGPIRWFICVHKSDVGQTRLVDILRVRE